MDLNLIKQKMEALQPQQKKKEYEKVDYTKVYWKPKSEGKYQIRLVPSKFNKEWPIQEVQLHYGYAKFPIYACISQSPYIKDGNEKTIVWDHNRGQPISHYKYSCSLGIKDDDTDLCNPNHKMFIQVVLIFFKNNRQNINKFFNLVLLHNLKREF